MGLGGDFSCGLLLPALAGFVSTGADARVDLVCRTAALLAGGTVLLGAVFATGGFGGAFAAAFTGGLAVGLAGGLATLASDSVFLRFWVTLGGAAVVDCAGPSDLVALLKMSGRNLILQC